MRGARCLSALDRAVRLPHHNHRRTRDLYSVYVQPKVFSSFRSSGMMKRFIACQTKRGTTSNGVALPSATTMPTSTNVMPRYIGCLLKANGPLVMRTVVGSKGLTDVPACLKSLSAHTFSHKPRTRNSAPGTNRHGELTSWVPGTKRCRSTMSAIAAKRKTGGRGPRGLELTLVTIEGA